MIVSWTIYFKPRDNPNCYVARRFHNDQPGAEHLVAVANSGGLEWIREHLRFAGFTRLERHPDDDHVIVETWL